MKRWKLNWKRDFEMELEILKDKIGNIGKWNWKHWKMELERLENEIENIGKWHWENWKIHLEIGIRNWICWKLE